MCAHVYAPYHLFQEPNVLHRIYMYVENDASVSPVKLVHLPRAKDVFLKRTPIRNVEKMKYQSM